MIVYLKVEVQVYGLQERKIRPIVERIQMAIDKEFELSVDAGIEITTLEHAGKEES